MVRVLGSLLVLGLVAASCSSDATKKQPPPTNSDAAGEGGDNGEGGASAGSSGNAPNGGASGAPAEAGSSGDDGGAMPGGGTSPNGGSGGSGGTVSDLTDGYLSGTRLRAVLQVAGTAQLFVGWHDSMLDIDCDFQVDSAGTQRCLPTNTVGSVGFSDAACKQPIVAYNAGDTLDTYAPDPGYVFTCGMGPRFLSVGALVTATEFHSKDPTGACGPASSFAPGQTVHHLGAAVVDSTFVGAAKVASETRDARISANVRVASDGSRQVTSFYDATRKAECNPLEVSAGGWACVPDARAYIEYYFSDPGCMTPAAFHPAYAQQVCGFTPAIIQNTTPHFMSTYFEVGAKVTAAVYQSNGTTCPAYDPSPPFGATFYDVGKAVPLSAFASFTLSNEGTGRVQVETLRTGPGPAISRENFYDGTLGLTCNAQVAADLVKRCLPIQNYQQNVFSDALCKQAIWQTNAGTPLPADLVYILSLQTNGGEAIFKIGPKAAAPAKAYQLNGLDCQELLVAPGTDFYLTTIVPPSDLPAVTRKVE